MINKTNKFLYNEYFKATEKMALQQCEKLTLSLDPKIKLCKTVKCFRRQQQQNSNILTTL